MNVQHYINNEQYLINNKFIHNKIKTLQLKKF